MNKEMSDLSWPGLRLPQAFATMVAAPAPIIMPPGDADFSIIAQIIEMIPWEQLEQ